MKTWSKSDLRKLLHADTRTLMMNPKMPPVLFKYIEAASGIVVQKAFSMNIQSERIPFVPVIPKEFLSCSPYELATMMQCGTKKGGSIEIAMEFVVDLSRAPYIPYFIFDIEDGHETLGMSPTESQMTPEYQGRRALRAMEVVALATHTDVLSRNNIYAFGSFYSCDGARGIDLRVDDNGHPVLADNDLDLDQQRWGTPSCGLEIVCQHPKH